MERKIFKPGETVIALTDPLNNQCQPRVKGNSYIVNSVLFCSKCGTQKINIGSPARGKTGTLKCNCGNKQDHEGLAWTNSEHFARPKDLDIEIAIAVKQENYELAADLHKILNP